MDSKITITKLNNSNYFTWKFKMQMILIKEKLWKTISEPAPATTATDRSSWTTADETARALIALSVEDNQLSLIMNKVCAKSTWNALQEFHEKSTIVNKMTLMRNMFDTKMTESTSIEEHIEEMSNYFQKLHNLGVTAFNNDDIKTAILLSSLPESYRTLVTSLESRDNLTWSLVTSKLMDESKHRAQKSFDSDEKLLKLKNEKQFCRYCKRSNHTIDQCRILKSKKSKNNDQTKVDMIEESKCESTNELLLGICFNKSNELDN